MVHLGQVGYRGLDCPYGLDLLLGIETVHESMQGSYYLLVPELNVLLKVLELLGGLGLAIHGDEVLGQHSRTANSFGHMTLLPQGRYLINKQILSKLVSHVKSLFNLPQLLLIPGVKGVIFEKVTTGLNSVLKLNDVICLEAQLLDEPF